MYYRRLTNEKETTFVLWNYCWTGQWLCCSTVRFCGSTVRSAMETGKDRKLTAHWNIVRKNALALWNAIADPRDLVCATTGQDPSRSWKQCRAWRCRPPTTLAANSLWQTSELSDETVHPNFRTGWACLQRCASPDISLYLLHTVANMRRIHLTGGSPRWKLNDQGRTKNKEIK